MKVNKKLNAVVTTILMTLTLFTNTQVSASAADPVITPAVNTSIGILRSDPTITYNQVETLTITVDGFDAVPATADISLVDSVTAGPMSGTQPITVSSCTPTGLRVVCTVVLPNLIPGTHDFSSRYDTATAPGLNQPSVTSTTVVVSKAQSHISISTSSPSIQYGDNETVTISFWIETPTALVPAPESVTANLDGVESGTIGSLGFTCGSVDVNGVVSCTKLISGVHVAASPYTINATYNDSPYVFSSNAVQKSFTITKRATHVELDLVDKTTNYGESRTPIARVYYLDSNNETHAVTGDVALFTSDITDSFTPYAAFLGRCTLVQDGNKGVCRISTRQYPKAQVETLTVRASYQGNDDFDVSYRDEQQHVSLNTPVINIYNTSESSTAWDNGNSTFDQHPDFCAASAGSVSPTPDVFTGINPVGCNPDAIHTLYGDLRPLTVTVENSNDLVPGVNSSESDPVWFQPEGDVSVVTDIPIYNNTPTGLGAVVGYESTCTLTRYTGYSACTVWVHPALIAGAHEIHATYTPTVNNLGDSNHSTIGGSWAFYDSATATGQLDVFRAPSVTTIESVTPGSISTYPETVTVAVKVAGRELNLYDGMNVPTVVYGVAPAPIVTTCVALNASPSLCGPQYGYQLNVETPTSVSGLTTPYLSGISSADGNTLAINGFYGCSLTAVLHQAVCSIDIPFNELSPSDQHQYYSNGSDKTPYSLAANYIGDINYLPSASAAQDQSVLKAHPTISISTDADSSTIYSDTVTITVTVLGVAGAEAVTFGTGVRVTDTSAHPYADLANMECGNVSSADSNGRSGFTCEIQTNRLHSSALLNGQRTLSAEYLGDSLYYAGDTATVGLNIAQIPGVFKPSSVQIAYGSTPVIPISFVKPGNDNEHPWVLGEDETNAEAFSFPTCIAIDYMSVDSANGTYVIDCNDATNNQSTLARKGYAWDYSFTYKKAVLTTSAVTSSQFLVNVGCPNVICGTTDQTFGLTYGQAFTLDGYYSFSMGNPGTAPRGVVLFYDNGETTTVAGLLAPDSNTIMSNIPANLIGGCLVDKNALINYYTSIFNSCYVDAALAAGTHNIFGYFLAADANYASRWSSNKIVLTVAKADPLAAFNIVEPGVAPGDSFTAQTTVSRMYDDPALSNYGGLSVNFDQRGLPTGTVDIYRGSEVPGNKVGTCSLGNAPSNTSTGCDTVINTLSASMAASPTPYTLHAVYRGDSNHNAATSNTDSITVSNQPAALTLTLTNKTAHVGDIDTVTATVTGDGVHSLAGVVIAISTLNAATHAAYSGPVSHTCTPVYSPNTVSCSITFTLNETGTVVFSAQATSLALPYSPTAMVATDTLTALAAWHTVTYDYNGGTWVSGPTTQREYQSTALAGPVVTMNGFDFAGWTESGSAVVMTSYSFAADKTVYAKWTPTPPAPVFTGGGGVVTKVTPVLSWSNPASITTTTALSSAQLNAVVTTPAGLAGTFSYSPAAGTLLPAGTQTLSVTFTPTNTTNYSSVSTTVSIVVTAPAAVAATVSISNLSAVYNGSAHAVAATTTPAGLSVAITYNGSSAAPVNAGTYSVVATITTAGSTGSSTATLTISKATPVISWSAPSNAPAGSTLSGAQLNATASVPGTFDYSPASGSSVAAGTNSLSVTFTPNDSTNYTNATGSVDLVGVAQNLAVTFASGSSTISKTQLAKVGQIAAETGVTITIVGYVQPTKNKASDMRLSLARANAAKAQILKLYPNAKIIVVAKGSTINNACSASQNRCVLITAK